MTVLIVGGAGAASAQEAPAPVPTVQSRIERARSLAVVGNLTAAATELETLRNEATEDSVREVVRILLMVVYIQQSNYTRADALLTESFKDLTAPNENATRRYFALAGQLLNGARSRLGRYREFGLNPANVDLLAEARNDIDQLRILLERVVQHAKEIRQENSRSEKTAQNLDAIALLEEATAVRLTLARDAGERAQWQRELADARQRLIAPQELLASVNQRSTTRSNKAALPITSLALVPSITDAATGVNSRTEAAPPPHIVNLNPPAPSLSAAPPAAANEITRSGTAGGETPPATTTSTSPPSPTAPSGETAGKSKTGNAQTRGALAVGDSLVEKAKQKIAPSYPIAARNMRVTGIVIVHVVVNADGSVEAVEWTSGPALLQQAAVEAVRRWKFRQTMVDGHPVRVRGYIRFNFTL